MGLKDYLTESGWLSNDENQDKKNTVPLKSASKTTDKPVTFKASVNPLNVDTEHNASKAEQATQYFMDLLDKSDLPGPDFREFYKALLKSKKMLGAAATDEKMLYVVTLSNIDELSLDVIMSSKDHYTSLMEERYNSFLASDTQKRQSNSDAMQETIQNTQNVISDKQEQIKQLTNEITELQSQLKTMNTEMEKENKTLDSVKNAFTTAYSNVTSEMNQVGQKCQVYFQNTPTV